MVIKNVWYLNRNGQTTVNARLLPVFHGDNVGSLYYLENEDTIFSLSNMMIFFAAITSMRHD